MKLPDSIPREAKLAAITQAIHEFLGEAGVTYPEGIAILELIKHELLKDAPNVKAV